MAYWINGTTKGRWGELCVTHPDNRWYRYCEGPEELEWEFEVGSYHRFEDTTCSICGKILGGKKYATITPSNDETYHQDCWLLNHPTGQRVLPLLVAAGRYTEDWLARLPVERPRPEKWFVYV